MSWNLSDGAKKALLYKQPSIQVSKIGTTISFGDGTGAGGNDQILDSANGLAVFGVQDHILVVGGTFNNIMVQAKVVVAGAIDVPAGTFTTVAAGTAIALIKISTGSLAQVFKNFVMDGYSGVRPSNANATESGTKLVSYTKNGGAFVPGQSANGLNFGNLDGTTLQMAIDPVTGIAEVCRGVGLVTGTLGYVRVYANNKVTGASTDAIRMDGAASTSGSDVNLPTGLNIVAGVNSEAASVNFTVA